MLGHCAPTSSASPVMHSDDALSGSSAAADGSGQPPDAESLVDIPLLWLDATDALDGARDAARERAEARRIRHREVQRRFAARKKEKLQQSRALLELLEAKYKLLALASELQLLAEENKGLEDSCLAYTLASPPKSAVHRVIQSQMDAIRDSYAPLSEPQWAQLLRHTLQEYELSRWQRDERWTATDATAMGWRDRLLFDESSIRLEMEKDFTDLDSREFAERAWDRLSSPEQYAQLFSPGLTVKMQVLQRINVDAVVVNRCIHNPRTNAIAHALLLFCRVLRGRDSIVIIRSLEETAAQQAVKLGEQQQQPIGSSADCEQWPQVMSSYAFAPRRDGGCRFHYRSWVRNSTAASPKYWAREFPVLLWRFEAITVAPMFSLRTEKN